MGSNKIIMKRKYEIIYAESLKNMTNDEVINAYGNDFHTMVLNNNVRNRNYEDISRLELKSRLIIK